MQKDSDRRYSSVEQLVDDLNRYLNHYPILAKPDTPWYKAKKFVQRNRTVSVMTAGFSTAILGFVIALSFQYQVIQIERDNAIREAANSNQVTNFLQEMFAIANPYISGEITISPKDLIDNAKEQAIALEADKAIKGKILTTLASVYLSMGDYQQVSDTLQLAKKNLDKDPDSPPIYKIESISVEAELAYANGNYEKAKQLISPIVDQLDSLIIQAKAEPEKTLLLNVLTVALIVSATVTDALGDPQAALAHAIRAKNIVEQLGDNGHYGIAGVYGVLGGLYRQLNQFNESEEMLLLSAEHAKAAYGEENLELAYAYNQLASTYSNLDKFEEGAEYAKLGLRIRQKLFPNGHAEVMASLGNVANLTHKIGDLDEAIGFRRQAVDMSRELFGDQHIYTGANMLSLASLLMEKKQFDEAEKYTKTSGIIHKQTLPEGNLNLARIPNQMGKISFHQNKFEDAKNFFNDALTIVETSNQPNHWLAAEALSFIALINHREDRKQEANRAKQRALQIYADIFGVESKRYAFLQNMLKDV